MRKVRLEVCFAGMLVAALAWTAGCEEWTYRKAPLEPKPQGYSELETVATQGDVVKPVVAQGPATTPRKAYEIYRTAIKTRAFETCWRLMSKGTQDSFDAQAAELHVRAGSGNSTTEDVEVLHILGLTRDDAPRLTGKMLMMGTFRRADARDPREFERITRTEFDHEAMVGERAQVYVRPDDSRGQELIRMVREGGVWYIDLTRPGGRRP